MKMEWTIEAATIEEMAAMSPEQYRSTLEFKLFFVDHHGILRAAQGEYPVATTKVQLRALLDYLKGVEAEIDN
jgi:hypothetical protein